MAKSRGSSAQQRPMASPSHAAKSRGQAKITLPSCQCIRSSAQLLLGAGVWLLLATTAQAQVTWETKAASKAEAIQKTASIAQAWVESSSKYAALDVDGDPDPEHACDSRIVDEWWTNYKQQYNKQYAELQTERVARMNFCACMRRVIAVNLDPSKPWWAACHSQSDLDFDTFASRYLQPPSTLPLPTESDTLTQSDTQSEGRRLQELPSSVNWVVAGKVTSVKNQANCGACWAFTSTSTVESAYLIAYNKTADQMPDLWLSQQQLVDCATQAAGYSGNACVSGSVDGAYEYMTDHKITVNKLYPYTATFGTCVASTYQDSAGVQLVGQFGILTSKSVTAFRTVLARQPTVNYITVNAAMWDYSGGLFNETAPGTVNHAVVAVGYEINPDGTGWWLIKNSWGSTWGEQGFGRLAIWPDKTSGLSQMYEWIFYPPMTFTGELGTVPSYQFPAGFGQGGWVWQGANALPSPPPATPLTAPPDAPLAPPPLVPLASPPPLAPPPRAPLESASVPPTYGGSFAQNGVTGVVSETQTRTVLSGAGTDTQDSAAGHDRGTKALFRGRGWRTRVPKLTGKKAKPPSP